MAKRITTQDELDRWAERGVTEARHLDDPKAIQKKLDSYFDVNKMSGKQRATYQNDVFPRILRKLGVSDQPTSKSSKRIRRTVTRTVETVPQQQKPKNDSFNKIAFTRGRRVYAREVKIRGKTYLRDRKGRFARKTR